jgi:hypothetical protein
VIHERIDHGANLLKNHVFQFDFLNDEFTKLPQSLQDIINDEEKRKKLVVYINPPYKRGLGVANTKWHRDEIGGAKDELYIQFLYRIYIEIPNCKVGVFSKLKMLNAPDFLMMRQLFRAKIEKLFIAPADTFDNVKGKFPIGFQIYDTFKKEIFTHIKSDVFGYNNELIGFKGFSTYDDSLFLNKWLASFKNNDLPIGKLIFNSNDFQHQARIRFVHFNKTVLGGDGKFLISPSNLIISGIYLTLRQCIEASWINDRDQFLYPTDGWQTDKEFQNDCLAYALFHGQNRITSSEGTNHWIPFTEQEVNAQAKFVSNFMTDFMKGKIKQEASTTDLFSGASTPTEFQTLSELKSELNTEDKQQPLQFSTEATAVFDAGRELWKYYHKTIPHNAPSSGAGGLNASLYDIREYFQGRNDKGRMNSKSDDATYMTLIGELRSKLAILADAIKPKVYEYGFLKE